MGNLDCLFGLLEKVRAWDIQIPGFIDRDERIPRFTPMSQAVYIALEDGYLCLEAVADEGQLSLRLLPEPQMPEALEGEDEEFSLGSYGQIFLQDPPSPRSLTRVRIAINDGSDPSRSVVRCVEFTFGGSLVLFADPAYHFGIRLQGVGAYERWRSENSETTGRSGPLRELVRSM
jgi:hypothetical protein